MRLAICDDERFFTTKLSAFVTENYPSIDLLIETFDCGEALISYYSKGQAAFDMILLDIEMKKMDGLQTAKILRQLSPDTLIVFVTSHEELACMGYEVSAYRFLIKPVNGTKLIEAIEAAIAQKRQAKTILVKNAEGEYALRLDEIRYFESQNQNTVIYTESGCYTHRYSISDYAKALRSEDFYLIHRSYLVNLKYVKGFHKLEITLESNTKLPLSRLRYSDFADTFHKFISRTAF